MSGVDESAVSEAVAAAFGRSAPSVEEWDRLAWDAFGRRGSGDAALIRDLQECGYTERGARWVLSFVNDLGYDDGVLTGGLDGLAPGTVREEAYERARGVLRRHGRAEAVEAIRRAGPSAAVSDARDQLATAYAATAPGARRELAERYADAAVKQCLESAARAGWSEQQVLELLSKQRAGLETRKGGRR